MDNIPVRNRHSGCGKVCGRCGARGGAREFHQVRMDSLVGYLPDVTCQGDKPATLGSQFRRLHHRVQHRYLTSNHCHTVCLFFREGLSQKQGLRGVAGTGNNQCSKLRRTLAPFRGGLSVKQPVRHLVRGQSHTSDKIFPCMVSHTSTLVVKLDTFLLYSKPR